MKAFHEHKAKKRFGQNFLHDQGVIERIVRAINPKPDQNLVEIGPGLGALTTHVLPKAVSLNVVELDRDVIPKLEVACTGLGSLNIFQHDAMKFDFGQLYSEQAGKIRVFGNLPYNVSTPLMFHLFSVVDRIQDMHFMLQKEVVERLAAQPNTKAYGRLTVMAQYYCKVEFLFVVKPGAFNPAPKVDSAIVRLVPRTTSEFPTCDTQLLQKILTAAFSKRRKTLRNALRDLVSTELMESANIDPGRRPETLSVAEFVSLTNLLSQQEA